MGSWYVRIPHYVYVFYIDAIGTTLRYTSVTLRLKRSCFEFYSRFSEAKYRSEKLSKTLGTLSHSPIAIPGLTLAAWSIPPAAPAGRHSNTFAKLTKKLPTEDMVYRKDRKVFGGWRNTELPLFASELLAHRC